MYDEQPVERHDGKMGKSLKNAVTPDDIYRDYGADTLRLYEMFMGPLDASRPWNTRDITGVHRLLRRFWANVVDEESGALRVTDAPADEETQRLLHRTVDKVRADMGTLEFNTAIAKLFELNNRLTEVVADTGESPRDVVETMTLMLAPLAPHIAEEVWARLGHDATITYESFPTADAALLVDAEIDVPVQINGKVRGKVRVATGADDIAHEAAARADEKIAALLDGVEIRKVIVVPGRMVNFVVAG